MSFRSRLPPLAIIASTALACNDPAGVLQVSKATPSGISGVGVPGWELADTATVTLTFDNGSPAPEARVIWSVREGGGSVQVLDSITDASGRVRAVWTLGTHPGTNRLSASTVSGIGVEFTAVGRAFQAEHVSSTGRFACGTSAGEVWCWVPGGGGSLGLPGEEAVSIRPDGQPAWSPVRVGAGRALTEIAVVQERICGLDVTGAAWCAHDPSSPFEEVPGLPPARNLVSTSSCLGCGSVRFCALAIADSTAWCWQPMGGDPPTRLAGSPAFTRIWYSKADGSYPFPMTYPDSRGCGLLADSSAVCWGRGAPGDGSSSGGISALVPVAGGHRFVELAVGDRFTCGRTGNGEVWCWGGAGGVPAAYLPVLFRRDALLIGTWQADVSVWGADRHMVRREGANLPTWDTQEESAFYQPPRGLEGLSVARLGENTSNCLFLSDGEVYCSTEEWTGSEYFPVPPARP